jgi:glycosyltransferase involved in cell wall biosynthesis
VKLLILTQYFPPEVGAPQNRLYELACRLQAAGVEITVLTAMPNYPQMEIYADYKGKKFVTESMNGLMVYRSSIYVSKSKSVLARLGNYFSFVISSARTGTKIKGNFDYLFCESPPLFLGYSALYLARKKKAALIFNVSDLWPESAEKLGVVTNRFLLKLAYRLEAKLYRRSAFVTGQTQGICADIQRRFREVKTYWLPNGVDLAYFDPAKIPANEWRRKNNFSDADVLFLYAGIIGIAQGLEIILEAAVDFIQQPRVKFILMGSGPEKQKLQAIKQKRGLENVYFFDPVTKTEMPSVLRSVNAAIVPLRKLALFLGAIPSKIFENLAMEVPVLLGVDGEARELFIRQGNCGIYFEPGNSKALSQAVKTLLSDPQLAPTLGRNGREFVSANFNREKIAEAFYNRLKQTDVA